MGAEKKILREKTVCVRCQDGESNPGAGERDAPLHDGHAAEGHAEMLHSLRHCTDYVDALGRDIKAPPFSGQLATGEWRPAQRPRGRRPLLEQGSRHHVTAAKEALTHDQREDL